MSPQKKPAAKPIAKKVSKMVSRKTPGKAVPKLLKKNAPQKLFPPESLSSPAEAEDVIHAVGAGAYIIQKGLFVGVNSLYEKMTGYRAGELVGTKLLDHIHPDDRASVCQNMLKNLKTKKPNPYEYRFIKKTGEILRILETVSPCVHKKKPAVQGSIMDITGYTQTRERLHLPEDRYRKVLEDIDEGYFETDLKGNLTFVNDAECQQLKYSREELIGMNYREFSDEKTARELKKLFNIIFKTGKPVKSYEGEFVSKQGHRYVSELSVSLMVDEKRKPVGFRGLSRDITQSKNLEATLKQSDERFKALFDQSLDGVFIHDLEGNFLDINPAALNVLGYERDEFLSLNFASLLDQEQIPKAAQVIDELVQTGIQQKPSEFKLKHRNGSYVYAETRSVGVYRHGKLKAILGISRDVTGRKRMEDDLCKSEERYRTILEDFDEGYFENDLKGNLTFVNDAMCHNLGYTREELIGMNYRVYNDKAMIKKIYDIFADVYQTGKPSKRYETAFIKKDGTKHFSEATGSLMRDTKGEPTGFRGVTRNIDERKRMEEERRKSEERYRSILEAIDEGFCELDMAGNVTFTNNAGAKMIGGTPETVIGTNYRQYVDQSIAKDLLDVFKNIYKTGRPVKRVEVEFINKDGIKRYVEISGAMIRDTDGNPCGFRGLAHDITERKWVEDALLQSEAKYFSIIESIGDAYFETDITGVFTFINDKVCRDLGYTREELLHMTNRDLQDETSAQETYAIFNEVYETGLAVKEFQLKASRKDGAKAVFELSISLMRDTQGKPIGFRGLSRDITQRKKMEDAIRQSEEKHRTIIETIQDGYVEMDLAGRYTFLNDAVCKQLGYSRDEFIGMNGRQLQDEVNYYKTNRIFKDIYRTGKPAKSFEIECIRKDGTKGIYEYSASLMKDAKGQPIGFQGILRDITERKQMEDALKASEERARTIIATIPDPYFENDLRGKVTYINSAYLNLLGYTLAELQQINYQTYLDEKNAPIVADLYRTVYKTGLTMKNVEVEITVKSGEKRLVNLSVGLVRDSQGSPTGFHGIVRDITERKRGEELIRRSEQSLREYSETLESRVKERTAELEKAKVAAEVASRAKSDFMANISHEFQTPLNAVIGFTKVLQDRMFGELNEKQDEFIHYIAEAGGSLSRIITEILDATHAASGSMKLHFSPVSMVAALSKTTRLLAQQVEEKNQILTVDVDLDADVTIEADEQKIQQVFFHVLSNAVKYTADSGQIHVQVSRARHPFSKQEGIQVAITDTGTGIRAEDIPRLFQTFGTLESPYTRQGKGIGIGLALTRQLLELHGGDISVESEYERGSCFTIFLPLKQKKTESME